MKRKIYLGLFILLCFSSAAFLQVQNTRVVNTPLPVTQSGTWNLNTINSVTNPVAVTGTFWQATQPISGTIAISNFPATQSISISQTSANNDVDVLTLPAITIGNTGFNVNNSPTVLFSQSGTANDVDANITNASIAVTGTFFQAIQPISISQTTTNNDVDANITNASLAVTGTFWQTTQPVSFSNQSINLNQLVGTTIDVNSGAKSTGTLRVVIATDQPQLTNKLLVTPDSVALPANQSVNVNQINAVAPLMGAGATGTGSQRVTLAELSTVTNGSTGNISLGNTLGKTQVLKTGTLVTTAVTADQVVLTYTVTAGKTLYVLAWDASMRLTTVGTGATGGNLSLESPSGTKIDTNMFSAVGNVAFIAQQYSEPPAIAAGTVIRIVVTPAVTTSTTWAASFAGYEK